MRMGKGSRVRDYLSLYAREYPKMGTEGDERWGAVGDGKRGQDGTKEVDARMLYLYLLSRVDPSTGFSAVLATSSAMPTLGQSWTPLGLRYTMHTTLPLPRRPLYRSHIRPISSDLAHKHIYLHSPHNNHVLLLPRIHSHSSPRIPSPRRLSANQARYLYLISAAGRRYSVQGTQSRRTLSNIYPSDQATNTPALHHNQASYYGFRFDNGMIDSGTLDALSAFF